MKKSFLILMSVVFLLVGFGAWYFQWNESNQDRSSTQYGDLMYKAILTNLEEKESIILLEKVSSESSPYRSIAKLKLSLLLSSKEPEKSLAVYSELEQDPSIDPVISQLARYLRFGLLEKMGRFDEIKNINCENCVYFSSFEEMKAISLIEQKNTQEAIKLFQNISSDFNIHPGVRRNAIEIMNSIKP